MAPSKPTNEKHGRVRESYQTPYPDPLILKAGETVTIKERESEYVGWLWCVADAGKSGWVPEQYVEREAEYGRLLRNYDATELSVAKGDRLLLHFEESDWVWCTNRQGQSGWVPAANIKIDAKP
jgi:uncharacterized protein YgiM (DUF1202 family)